MFGMHIANGDLKMWTLWIISSVIGSAEPKVTMIETFNHEETCYHAQVVFSSTFTQNEIAFCEGSN